MAEKKVGAAEAEKQVSKFFKRLERVFKRGEIDQSQLDDLVTSIDELSQVNRDSEAVKAAKDKLEILKIKAEGAQLSENIDRAKVLKTVRSITVNNFDSVLTQQVGEGSKAKSLQEAVREHGLGSELDKKLENVVTEKLKTFKLAGGKFNLDRLDEIKAVLKDLKDKGLGSYVEGAVDKLNQEIGENNNLGEEVTKSQEITQLVGEKVKNVRDSIEKALDEGKSISDIWKLIPDLSTVKDSLVDKIVNIPTVYNTDALKQRYKDAMAQLGAERIRDILKPLYELTKNERKAREDLSLEEKRDNVKNALDRFDLAKKVIGGVSKGLLLAGGVSLVYGLGAGVLNGLGGITLASEATLKEATKNFIGPGRTTFGAGSLLTGGVGLGVSKLMPSARGIFEAGYNWFANDNFNEAKIKAQQKLEDLRVDVDLKRRDIRDKVNEGLIAAREQIEKAVDGSLKRIRRARTAVETIEPVNLALIA